MSDTAGLAPVAGAVTETWIDDSSGKQTVGNDSGEGAFAVGDRVVANCCPGDNLCNIVGGSGVVISSSDELARVRLDDPSGLVSEDGATWLHWIDLLPEPVPFSLTPEADAVLGELGEPWSTTPRETWQLNIEFACTELAALLIEKQKAYGAAAINNSPYGWKVHVITRLHEKLERAISLEDDADLVETFGDLAGVALIGQLKAAGLWRESE